MPYRLIRPLVFRFDAERAHGLTIAALKMLPETGLRETSPRLRTSVAGLDFPSPVGLAAGFDKNAEVPDALLRQGVGFVKGGTPTPRPHHGQPPPPVFRAAGGRDGTNRIGFQHGRPGPAGHRRNP